MKTNNLENELSKLNRNLEKINSQSRYYVYSANPFKFILMNFFSGVLHSLGSLFGTMVIAAVIVYYFSQINLNNILDNFTKQYVEQIQKYSQTIQPSQINP